MVHLHDEEDQHYDDTTISQEMQQFFDEWHYRILHSGLAIAWDRIACLRLALDIFETVGVEMTEEEKVQYSEMEDESAMITLMVQHLPMAARKTFEHFVLQLQLVVSTVVQVRHALEEGLPDEVAKCFEGGDSGPGQQILKQSIVEAGKQIHEAVEMHKSWKANTEARIVRLNISQDEAEHARQQLEAIQCQLDAFKGEQNAKSKSVLVGIAGKNDKMLVHSIFSTWVGWLIGHKMNKDIHAKFQKEIDDAEMALVNFRAKQLGISRGIIGRGNASADDALAGEILRIWFKHVIEEGHSKAADAKLDEMRKKFGDQQENSKAASKKVMMGMSAKNDTALVGFCFQGWSAAMAELKADAEIDALAKKAEAAFKEFKKKQSEKSRGVLDGMAGASENGLLKVILTAWMDDWKEGKKLADLEKMMGGNDAKFKSLNVNQKKNAKSVASATHAQEEENTIMVFFYAWATDTRTERVIAHYGGKLDQKKNQLDAVQTMFRSFASQLEQGIGNTPRSQRKSNRSQKGIESSAASATQAAAAPS